MGGAESYRVSVSCVGSPASVHGLDNVPAPQSQKNLERTRLVYQRLCVGTVLPEQMLSILVHEKVKSNVVLPIVPYKLYIVSLVAFFDAVYTDGVPICCITGVTSGETKHYGFINPLAIQ